MKKIETLILSLAFIFAFSFSLGPNDKKSFTNIQDALLSQTKVESLILNVCSDVDFKLYDSICKLSSLKELEISECPKILRLPKQISTLSLERLNFYWNGTGNEKIEYSEIGRIKSLKYLKLGPYNTIKELPNSFKSLKKLEELDLQLTSIQGIPNWINELENLNSLDISMCQIKSLPISKLKLMKNLKLIKMYDSHLSNDSLYMRKLTKSLNCKVEY